MRAFLLILIYFLLNLGTGEMAEAADPIREAIQLTGDDPEGNEIRSATGEILITRNERRALHQLVGLWRRHKGTALEPELLFRLGELYMRRARSDRFFEIHRDSEKILQFAPKVVQEASERSNIQRAIRAYDYLEKKYPQFNNLDLVIYNGAYARQQIDEERAAEIKYQQLIRDFPNSLLLPDVYLAIGEMSFKRQNYKEALDRFKKIRNYPNSRVYAYGIYKEAWVYYNLQKTEKAIGAIEEAIIAASSINKQERSRLDLSMEALNDLALFYSSEREAVDAVKYFQRIARELDPIPALNRLYFLYKNHGRNSELVVVLNDLIEAYPESESQLDFRKDLIAGYNDLDKPKDAVDQIKRLSEFCNLTENESCFSDLKKISYYYAQKWHLGFRSKGEKIYSFSSRTAYEIYFRQDLSEEENLDFKKFSYAELLFSLEDFRLASKAYDRVRAFALESPNESQEKVYHQAAFSALFSLEKATGNEWSDIDEKEFFRLGLFYISTYPESDNAVDVEFKMADIAFEKGRLQDAADVYYSLGWGFHRSSVRGKIRDKVELAQDRYFSILNEKKRYSELKEAAAELLLLGLVDVRKARVRQVYEEAYFAEIQGIEDSGEARLAIEKYKAFAEENRHSLLAPKAWWNASQLHFHLGEVQEGASSCYQMHRMFPRSSHGKDCLVQAVAGFEKLGRLDFAARVLLNLAKVEIEKANEHRELAADFFSLSGNGERAILMYIALVEEVSQDSRERLLSKAWVVSREYARSDLRVQIAARAKRHNVSSITGEIALQRLRELLETGERSEAFSGAMRVVGNRQFPRRVRAEARFIQGEILEHEYRTQSVRARPERLGLVLGIKTEKLEKAQQAYQAVIRYSETEMTLKSMQRLSEIYLDFAKTLREIELVGDVDEREVQALRDELEILALPMEERGMETLLQAVELSKKSPNHHVLARDLQSRVNELSFQIDLRDGINLKEPGIWLPMPNRKTFIQGARP